MSLSLCGHLSPDSVGQANVTQFLEVLLVVEEAAHHAAQAEVVADKAQVDLQKSRSLID